MWTSHNALWASAMTGIALLSNTAAVAQNHGAESESAIEGIVVRAAGAPLQQLDSTMRIGSQALSLFDPTKARRPSREHARSHPSAAPSKHCCAFRVYDANTWLYDDWDDDGYFSYLRLSFDVDTDYEVADIYADIYLIDRYGDYTRIFETEVFTIYGNSGIDDYAVEAELVSGFDADEYDLLIEVYDAYDDHLLVEYGAYDSSALSLLPMESTHYNARIREVHAHGGGGVSGTPTALLALLVLGWFRRARAGGVRSRRYHRWLW